MPDLSFEAVGASALTHTAVPLVALHLKITNAVADEPIQSIALRCQVQIDPRRRSYTPADQERLFELFGEPARWDTTMKAVLWTVASVNVPGFTGETVVDVQVPCSYDFQVGATKFFHAVRDGAVPLQLLFSGTIFHGGERGLSIAQIPWSKEAQIKMPSTVWRDAIEHFYPGTAGLVVRRELFDALYAYKIQRGLPTLDAALENLLAERGADDRESRHSMPTILPVAGKS